VAAIAEIVVGRRVRARGCPGLGVGVVVSVEGALKNVDGSSIPHVGFVVALVDFGPNYPGGRVVESFRNRELDIVADARRGAS
jgi:hypothetical protein